MIIERTYEETVLPQDPPSRVDSFLAKRISGLSRSALTAPGCEIFIDGKAVKKSAIVNPGQQVSLFYSAEVFDKVTPQNIILNVLYEDKDILVINKEQGMVVHPGAGNPENTIVNALAYRYGQAFIDSMADECDITRPGIVHRLDKDTSGVLIIALNSDAHAKISKQFQDRSVNKFYLAFCDGIFTTKEGDVKCFLSRDPKDRKLFCPSKSGGKDSWSHYEVLRQYPACALVKVTIHTGRTHQIRVHMKSLGHAVTGDVLYNSKPLRFGDKSLMLHSAHIEIKHPKTGLPMVFDAPVPLRFSEFEKELQAHFLK